LELRNTLLFDFDNLLVRFSSRRASAWLVLLMLDQLKPAVDSSKSVLQDGGMSRHKRPASSWRNPSRRYKDIGLLSSRCGLGQQ
jgi:hypothetical protein